MFKKKGLLIFTATIIMYIFIRSNNTYVPIEELRIISSFGQDVVDNPYKGKVYISPTTGYNYRTQPISGVSLTSEGKTIGEIRESKQLLRDKKFLFGLEKVVVAGEEFAKYGIVNWIDAFFQTPLVNDTAYLIVCKGNPEDLLNLDIPGYPTAGDYLDGIIRYSTEYHFFLNNYQLLDIYSAMDSEGKNVIVPYVEVVGNLPVISGIAIFKKDKMVRKLDIYDAKNMNMLRENNVRGILTLQKNLKEYIDFYATSKRTVKCVKAGDKYTFTINLSIKGEIINNTLYENLYSNPLVAKKFEKDMKDYVEKLANDFIYKMKNEYKMDYLQLGNVAAAKYGRNTGTDWDKVVSTSDIRVNVNVKLTKLLRGNYLVK